MTYETFVDATESKDDTFEFYVNFDDGIRIKFLVDGFKRTAIMEILSGFESDLSNYITVAKSAISEFVRGVEFIKQNNNIYQITNCKSCPLVEYQGGGCYFCRHPSKSVGLIYNENVYTLHENCYLKVVDLILTVKK